MILMRQSQRTERDGLQSWLASEIADLGSTLAPPEAGILLLDAQITDLETRCAAGQKRVLEHDRARLRVARPPRRFKRHASSI